MPPNPATEIAALPRLRVSELRAKFAVVFGEPTPTPLSKAIPAETTRISGSF